MPKENLLGKGGEKSASARKDSGRSARKDSGSKNSGELVLVSNFSERLLCTNIFFFRM